MKREINWRATAISASSLCVTGVLGITLLLAQKAVGQDSRQEALGTAASPSAVNVPSTVALAPMAPLAGFSAASYATGGKGLRNQRAGREHKGGTGEKG